MSFSQRCVGLGFDTTTNVIKDFGLSQFDNDASFTPTQPTLP
jgi:hypothetical protein